MKGLTAEINVVVSGLPPTMDVIAAAQYLNVSTWTVKNRIRAGHLRGYKQGNYWRIKREWLLEYESSLISQSEVCT